MVSQIYPVMHGPAGDVRDVTKHERDIRVKGHGHSLFTLSRPTTLSSLSYTLGTPYLMASEDTQQPEKKPALKDLQTFDSSYHLTCIMGDALDGGPPSRACE
jgi:hypothetical protein